MKSQTGFTLIELVFVIALIVVLSTYVVSRAFFNTGDSHGGEQLITELATRLYERRAEAQRLNGSRSATSFQTSPAPPLEFDMTDPATTASLVTDGVDANGDGIDDVTGDRLTSFAPAPGGSASTGTWNYVYRGDPIQMPKDWKLVQTPADLGTIPLIASGFKGRGIPVTRIGFDGTGQAFYLDSAGVWESTPAGTSPGKKINETPFWVFYFVRPDSMNYAVAVGVYPGSGITERFRFDGISWHGFADRVPSNK